MQGLNNGHEKHPKLVVVIVPLPAQGHLNQLLHLSHLITSYDIPVHYVSTTTHNHQAKVRLHGRNHDSKIHFHDFELPPFDPTPPPPNPNLYLPFPAHLIPLLEAASLHLREYVYHLILQLSRNHSRVIIIHDHLASSVVKNLISIPNVEAYTFMPVPAFTMFLDTLAAMPDSSRPFQLDLKDVVIPKFSNDATDLFKDTMTKEMFKVTKNEVQSLGFESGWLYNTSRDIEGEYINLLEKLKPNMKHFALGPLHPVVAGVRSQHQCLEWLDKQEKGSVVYISFGSTTSLTDDQIRELAIGLDQCGQKFIWVLRKADPADIFVEDHENHGNMEPQLPKGYEEKVRNKGFVIRDWAPQLEILAHPSVGGFMSHCGWNSCIESISMGVPIAAWPMHSDQPRNAFLVSGVLRVGVVVRDWAHRGELVTANTIKNAIKRLMVSEEGKEMKERAKKLGEAMRGSVAQGGVSCLEMDAFIAYITRGNVQMLSKY